MLSSFTDIVKKAVNVFEFWLFHCITSSKVFLNVLPGEGYSGIFIRWLNFGPFFFGGGVKILNFCINTAVFFVVFFRKVNTFF